MKFKWFFLVILFLSVSLVHAGPGTGAFMISEVRVEKGVVYLFPSSTTTIDNHLTCGSGSPVVLLPTDAGFDQMTVLALTALATKKNIKCWLQACVSSPWGNTRPKAYACGLLAD